MLVFSEIRGESMRKNQVKSKDRNNVYPLITTMVQAEYSKEKIFFHIKKSGMQFSARELRVMIGKVYKRMLMNRRVGQ
jgi:hypothetical protein